MLSLLGGASSHRMLELAHVGDEGMAGISIALQGAWAPHRVMVQIPTAAWKIKAEALREELNRRGALQDLLLRYTYTLLRQVSQSVVCHTYHTIPQRLSRWLLSARDRIDSDTLQLTQTFVADLLGVRRTGVSAAEQELQDQDVIRIRHGKLRILNRRRLEALACECYGVDKAETGTLHEALSDAQLATSTRQRIVVQ